MVLALRCPRGFGAEQLPLTARNGAGIMRLVVKAAYSFASEDSLERLDTPPKVVTSDEPFSEPASQAAVRIESDVSLDKPHTDLVVNGHAIAPGRQRVRSLDAGISYEGRILRRVRVFGERIWTRSLVGWTLSDPVPFETMPITYARAYGGSDEHGLEARNPWGTGYVSKITPALEGARAPNIEHPDALIEVPRDRPPPAGFGVVARHSQPRARYGGTYDAAWLDARFPLLPVDFDDRFNQCVDPQQWLTRPRGGEVIRIAGMSEQGTFAITLPPCTLRAGFHYKKRSVEQELALDGIVVDTDERTLTLTWRGTADVHGDPFQLLETVVDGSDVGRIAPARCC